VLAEFSSASVDFQKFVDHLRPLSPRYYSISSSSLVDSNHVSITVSVIRYQLFGLDRVGVATTYLADRVDIGDKVPVFLSRNDNFRLPSVCCVLFYFVFLLKRFFRMVMYLLL